MKYFEMMVNQPVVLVFVAMIVGGFGLLIFSLLGKKSTGDVKKGLILENSMSVVRDDDFEEIRENVFQLYKEIEIAKMKFRYAILEEKLDQNLYQKCEEKLKLLKKEHCKLVATDIFLEDFRIFSRKIENQEEKLDVFLHVSQYDYVMNKEKEVIRGTGEDRYQIEYKMMVSKNLETGNYRLLKKECVGKWIKK